METSTRLVTKSITWQLAGLIGMTAIGYAFTGSVSAGGGIALAGAGVGFVSYFVHELAWSRVRWGRKPG